MSENSPQRFRDYFNYNFKRNFFFNVPGSRAYLILYFPVFQRLAEPLPFFRYTAQDLPVTDGGGFLNLNQFMPSEELQVFFKRLYIMPRGAGGEFFRVNPFFRL